MNKLTDMGVERGFRSGWLYEFRSMLGNKYLVMSKVENMNIDLKFAICRSCFSLGCYSL